MFCSHSISKVRYSDGAYPLSRWFHIQSFFYSWLISIKEKVPSHPWYLTHNKGEKKWIHTFFRSVYEKVSIMNSTKFGYLISLCKLLLHYLPTPRKYIFALNWLISFKSLKSATFQSRLSWYESNNRRGTVKVVLKKFFLTIAFFDVRFLIAIIVRGVPRLVQNGMLADYLVNFVLTLCH